MGCMKCAAARAARAAKAAAAEGTSSGSWKLTMLDGQTTLYDNRLAAMAANHLAGGSGIITKVEVS